MILKYQINYQINYLINYFILALLNSILSVFSGLCQGKSSNEIVKFQEVQNDKYSARINFNNVPAWSKIISLKPTFLFLSPFTLSIGIPWKSRDRSVVYGCFVVWYHTIGFAWILAQNSYVPPTLCLDQI